MPRLFASAALGRAGSPHNKRQSLEPTPISRGTESSNPALSSSESGELPAPSAEPPRSNQAVPPTGGRDASDNFFRISPPQIPSSPDSLLERAGFEPSVPLLRKGSSGGCQSETATRKASHLQVQVRDGDACLEWFPIAFPFAVGPRVRIRLPPSVSLSHRCLPWLPAKRPAFAAACARIEAGEAAAGHKMDEAELAVLDRFEEVTRRPELMLEFTLQPGEMYFINNYTILHARTAFDDGDAEEDRRRHLLRLWLEVPQMRPVHPYIRSGGIEAVPGRIPSSHWSNLPSNRN